MVPVWEKKLTQRCCGCLNHQTKKYIKKGGKKEKTISKQYWHSGHVSYRCLIYLGY